MSECWAGCFFSGSQKDKTCREEPWTNRKWRTSSASFSCRMGYRCRASLGAWIRLGDWYPLQPECRSPVQWTHLTVLWLQQRKASNNDMYADFTRYANKSFYHNHDPIYWFFYSLVCYYGLWFEKRTPNAVTCCPFLSSILVFGLSYTSPPVFSTLHD